jgi:type III secretion protein R
MLNEQLYLIFMFAGLSLLPVFFVLTTSFVKIAMVCIMTRESLGVQQVPPNIVLYSLSLILSLYIMGPIYNNTYALAMQNFVANRPLNPTELIVSFQESSKPIKSFLIKHANENERVYFRQNVQRFWGKEAKNQFKDDDFMILVPAFIITELTSAFRIGFLIYLPSVIIDILVSNILMAMGMMMMSPVTISLPIKLLLFISVNGWSRLVHALLNTY